MTTRTPALRVRPVRAFSDNYIWLIDSPRQPGQWIAVDPGDAAPVLAELQRSGGSLAAILLTHHHPDHIGGAAALAGGGGIPVVGPDDARIDCLTRRVGDGERVSFPDLGLEFEVLHVPGHSPGSIALWDPAQALLLSGDAVYDGPLIDDAWHSNPEDYVETLQRLRELPVDRVMGGHFPSFGRQRFHALIDDYIAGRRAAGCPAERNRPS